MLKANLSCSIFGRESNSLSSQPQEEMVDHLAIHMSSSGTLHSPPSLTALQVGSDISRCTWSHFQVFRVVVKVAKGSMREHLISVIPLSLLYSTDNNIFEENLMEVSVAACRPRSAARITLSSVF